MKSNDIHFSDKANAALIMATLKIGTFLALLNENIINVALSKLMVVFSVSANTVQWLTSGYMLVLGILVPVTAYLIERLSTRELYLSSMILLLIGTILAAYAQNFYMLLGARLFQGLGGGVLMPLLMNTIMVLTPPEKRGSAMGSALIIILFAPAIGPTYGGLIIQTLNWRWIFIVLIPFMVLSILLGWFFLRNITEQIKKKLDILSFILSTIGFGSLLYGINNLCSPDSSKSKGIFILLIGIVALIIFILRQLWITNPLLNVRVFKSSMFSLGMILMILSYMVLFANFVLMPMFIEKVLGFSEFQTGLAVLPGGILGAILPPIFGILYDRYGPRIIVPSGFAVVVSGNFFISYLPDTAGIFLASLCYSVVLMGLNGTLAACQTNSLNQLPKENYPHGSAIMNTLMMVGSALGAAIFIAIMTLKQNQYLLANMNIVQATNKGISFAYLFVILLTVICFILSLFFRKESLSR